MPNLISTLDIYLQQYIYTFVYQDVICEIEDRGKMMREYLDMFYNPPVYLGENYLKIRDELYSTPAFKRMYNEIIKLYKTISYKETL